MTTAAATTHDDLVQSAVRGLTSLATLPEVTLKIIEITDDPESSARDLIELLRLDPALSARILKVVNSALYGLPRQIASMEKATGLLGMAAIKNIAVSASTAQLFRMGKPIEGFSGKRLWEHAVANAVAARLLSKSSRTGDADELFLTGLVADLGLLVERQIFEDKLGQVIVRFRREHADFCALEREIIGADHQAFGSALADAWGFPPTLSRILGIYHEPLSADKCDRPAAALVYVADTLSCRAEIGFCTLPTDHEIDADILRAAGLSQADIDAAAEALPEQARIAGNLLDGG